jgi:hypothetical protein
LNGDRVPCEEILIRLASRRGHILPNSEVAAEVFILRRGENRLSVFRKSISDIDVCKAALKRPYGAATLHTGKVRTGPYPGDIQVDVVEAEGEGTDIPGHAALTGLPDPITAPEKAERVASILRRQSRGIVVP